jgi:hypothetical protein
VVAQRLHEGAPKPWLARSGAVRLDSRTHAHPHIHTHTPHPKRELTNRKVVLTGCVCERVPLTPNPSSPTYIHTHTVGVCV